LQALEGEIAAARKNGELGQNMDGLYLMMRRKSDNQGQASLPTQHLGGGEREARGEEKAKEPGDQK